MIVSDKVKDVIFSIEAEKPDTCSVSVAVSF